MSGAKMRLTTHSTGARIVWLSSITCVVSAVRRARLIRAFGSFRYFRGLTMSVEIWSIFHDGVIAQVDGSVPGDITVTVDIEYLRQMFSENGSSIIVTLSACSIFKYQPFEPAEMLTSLSEINERRPEILYAKVVENDVIRIECVEGTLWLKYQAHSLSLDDGQSITLDELSEQCDKYWTDWEAKSESRD